MTPQGREGTANERDPLLGRVIDGRYTVLHLIGKGGMGAVYRAHQASLDRAVALKVLLGAPDDTRETEFQKRFFFEAQAAAKLKHPNTITVFDYGSEVVDGARYFFIAMELLEGRTLSQALRTGPLALPKALAVAVQICRSLREAHRHNVVHRDLKPGNVMLIPQEEEGTAEDEFVKVLDFGLAKTFLSGEVDEALTRVGTFLGSPRYVSPEQIEGRPVDPRSDIYSLGCVLYRMVSGEVPFDGTAPVEVMLKHLNEPIPELPSDVPPLVARLIYDCLTKEPEGRPSSMEAVIGRLKLSRAESGDVPFMSMSDPDSHSSTALPSPLPSRPKTQPTMVDRPSKPGAPSPRPATKGAGPALDLAIDETRPTRSVLAGHKRASRAPARSRSGLFFRGVLAGTLVAGALLLAFELGLDTWLTEQLQGSSAPAPSPSAAPSPEETPAK